MEKHKTENIHLDLAKFIKNALVAESKSFNENGRQIILILCRLDVISVLEGTTEDAYKWTETQEEKHYVQKRGEVHVVKYLNDCKYRDKKR